MYKCQKIICASGVFSCCFIEKKEIEIAFIFDNLCFYFY